MVVVTVMKYMGLDNGSELTQKVSSVKNSVHRYDSFGLQPSGWGRP